MSSFRDWFFMASRINNWFFYLHINFEILPNDLNWIGFVWILVLRFNRIFIKWNNLIVLLIQGFFKHRVFLGHFVCQRLWFWRDISSCILGLSITTRLHWWEKEINTIQMFMVLWKKKKLSLVVYWYLFIRMMKSFFL